LLAGALLSIGHSKLTLIDVDFLENSVISGGIIKIESNDPAFLSNIKMIGNYGSSSSLLVKSTEIVI